jgi:hypothetical protein
MTMAEDNVDWRMLGTMVEALIKEVRGLNEQARVHGAILKRLDTTQAAMRDALHEMHVRMARVLERLEQHDRRIGTLERNNPPPSPIPPAD